MIIGGDNEQLAGYIGRKFSSQGELREDVHIDLNNPHMVTVCGKRGSGKSHTLGVFMEELMSLPRMVQDNLSGLVVDAMGIYWSLQVETQSKDALSDWDLTPEEYPITVYYPAGLEDRYEDVSEYFHEGFELYPSELTLDDWFYVLDIDETQAQAGLLAQIIEEVEEEFGQYYGLHDVIERVERSEESANIKEALLRRLEKADSWGVFSSTGNTIDEIVKGGEFVVLDLSGAGALPWNLRTLLTGILARKAYNERSFERSREEVARIRGADSEIDFPLVWLFLDEAHLFAPSGQTVPSTEPLVEWVRQGRRPGLSVVMATQQPGALDSRILSQCDTVVIHRLTAGQDSDAVGDKVSELHDTNALSHYMENIPKDPGYAYVMNDSGEKMVPVKIRPRRSWHAGGSAKLEEFL
ncbi:ATP-binding protein [Haloprofundus salilacus]|uniref:ATP-binding protein n=1 Tax=Haloprofundus salilacus TaxID=2876190 RepID=UPI001CCBEFC4|nr:ATP-binding protein [Haloprofundus salilacus]